jgi:hypothetical protein
MKLVTGVRLSSAAANFAALAALYGADVEITHLSSSDGLQCSESEIRAAPDAAAYVIDVGGLSTERDPTAVIEPLLSLVRRQSAPVLVLVSSARAPCGAVLAALSGGTLTGVAATEHGRSVEFADTGSELVGPLSGQSFKRVERPLLVLEQLTGDAAPALMSVDGHSCFVALKNQACELYVWAAADVFDPSMSMTSEFEFEGRLDAYVPAIAFVRHVLKDRGWHNPNPGVALVIDDPLLARRYGCLDFPQLLSSARRLGYVVTLAFIPWNHFRSRVSDVQPFLRWRDCFAVCVHGCDHTAGEYAASDANLLIAKNRTALQRMRRLEHRTGLAFERVMVCPQEEYSLHAIRSFARHGGFLAVANSRCIAMDSSELPLQGADLLSVVQGRYFGVPILKRCYPSDRAVLTLCQFLGKPTVLAEHHGLFRQGLGRLEAWVAWVNSRSGFRKWRSIEGVARTTCTQRRTGDSTFELRIFSDEFELDHLAPDSATYHVTRRVAPDVDIESILVNGVAADFVRKPEFVTFSIEVASSTAVRVELRRTPPSLEGRYPTGIGYQARVAARRVLSEARDKLRALFLPSAST